MNFDEVMAELPKLTDAQREEVIRRLAELDEIDADRAALARARELASGLAQPKSQAEVFRNARAALECKDGFIPDLKRT